MIKEEIDNVVAFMKKAGQETPSALTTPRSSERVLRARLILEEAFELIEKGLGVSVSFHKVSTGESVLLYSDHLTFRISNEANPVEALDGAADLFWVGVAGTAIIFGADLQPVLDEVNSSNQSKFIDGHRREDGKWVKGPSYYPADIASVLKDRIAKIGNGYLAFLGEDVDNSWYIVSQTYWDDNGYVNDVSEDIIYSLPGFYECMENLVAPEKDVSVNEAENMLKDLGFKIIDLE